MNKRIPASLIDTLIEECKAIKVLDASMDDFRPAAEKASQMRDRIEALRREYGSTMPVRDTTNRIVYLNGYRHDLPVLDVRAAECRPGKCGRNCGHWKYRD